jgi:hypothetical protein
VHAQGRQYTRKRIAAESWLRDRISEGSHFPLVTAATGVSLSAGPGTTWPAWERQPGCCGIGAVLDSMGRWRLQRLAWLSSLRAGIRLCGWGAIRPKIAPQSQGQRRKRSLDAAPPTDNARRAVEFCRPHRRAQRCPPPAEANVADVTRPRGRPCRYRRRARPHLSPLRGLHRPQA